MDGQPRPGEPHRRGGAEGPPKRSAVLRVVLDPNVLVSALISPAGVPAQVIEAVLDGDIDHVASLRWLSEADGLAEAPRFRRWFTQEDAEALIERLWVIAPDPSTSGRLKPGIDALDAQSGQLFAHAAQSRT